MDGDIIITGHDQQIMEKKGYVEKHCPECGNLISITQKIVDEGEIKHCKDTAIPVKLLVNRGKYQSHQRVTVQAGD